MRTAIDSSVLWCLLNDEPEAVGLFDADRKRLTAEGHPPSQHKITVPSASYDIEL